MKLAYMGYLNTHRGSGVWQKVAMQARLWKEQGHEVIVSILSPSSEAFLLESLLVDSDIRYGVNLSGLVKASACQAARIFAWRPDLVYLRYAFYTPGWLRVADRLPTVLEINSDDVVEARSHWPIPLFVFHMLTRKWFLRKARAKVFLTNELARKFSARAPYAVIPNGADFRSPTVPALVEHREPTLLFVASRERSWHGLDKVIWLARQKPSWHFEIVGEWGATPGADLPNVTFQAPTDRETLLEIAGRSDVGIGSLSLYKKGMNEACPLKVRDYLSMGLPVIIGYEDSDFPSPPTFMLQLSNSSDNVISGLQSIEAFVKAWRGKRVTRNEIKGLDAAEKEKRRTAFFAAVLRGEAEARVRHD